MELYLITEAYCLEFEDIIWSAISDYKQLVDADDWKPGPGSATPAAEPTITAEYKAALPTEPFAFQTMMCKDIYTYVDDAMSAFSQADPYSPKCGGGRGIRGG